MNLVIHAIVVVTIGVVTSRIVVVILVVIIVTTCYYLQNKIELQTCFQSYYIIANENLLCAKISPELPPLNKACM